jgi:kynureninase
MMNYENNAGFAFQLDENDPLKKWRNEFLFPQHNEKNVIYFTGNSLGLQPKATKKYIEEELEDWAKFGVDGHFEARRPWFSYHEQLTPAAARLVGALPQEVVVTHSLSTNIHLLMASFYNPLKGKKKIICEKKAFPSDQYALETQVQFYGLRTEDCLIEVSPREGEHTIREEDVEAAIKQHKDDLALVFIGGVNYYTGQLFDMERITKAAHAVGAYAGFDLAHAVGNIHLHLHDWQVDFAAWCSYKYLNSSPGGVSGIYVRKDHTKNKSLRRFAGWWGHNKERRFLMEPGFDPIPSAESWQLSNAPVLGMAAHLASLKIFDEVGMPALCAKRDLLTGYLEFVINDISRRKSVNFEIITPADKTRRGAQLSILLHGQGKALFNKLTEQGVIADWREPNVIRMAPVPLYNSFTDIYEFGQILEKAL